MMTTSEELWVRVFVAHAERGIRPQECIAWADEAVTAFQFRFLKEDSLVKNLQPFRGEPLQPK